MKEGAFFGILKSWLFAGSGKGLAWKATGQNVMFGQRLEISDVLVERGGREVGPVHLSGLCFDLHRTKACPSEMFQCRGEATDTGEQFSEGEFLYHVIVLVLYELEWKTRELQTFAISRYGYDASNCGLKWGGMAKKVEHCCSDGMVMKEVLSEIN